MRLTRYPGKRTVTLLESYPIEGATLETVERALNATATSRRRKGASVDTPLNLCVLAERTFLEKPESIAIHFAQRLRPSRQASLGEEDEM